MYKSQIVVFAFILLAMMNVRISAKEAPAAPRPGPANAEFQRVFGEWKTFNGQLGALRAKYRTAPKEERPELEKQWNELLEKGKVLQPQFYRAAEKAFAEAPNADKQIIDLLLGIFADGVAWDDFENTARIGKLLVDNHCSTPRIVSDAGIAAVCIGDFDAAEKYLGMANKDGYYRLKQPNDEMADLGKRFLSNLENLKKSWDKEQRIRRAEAVADDLPRVLIKTNKGDIEVELFENEAPNTVANFITLVEKGYYNGKTFHRVLSGFMAQGGGGPQGEGDVEPGYTIPDECKRPGHRLHFRGSLSMAKETRPDTGGSQFFITFAPTSHLDGIHTVFGRVKKGIDVLAKIQRRDPNATNPPDPDKIIEAKVLRKRPHEYVVKKTGK